MSLYTDDNYFGIEHSVLKTKSDCIVINGEEHEIVMCLDIRYGENNKLLSVDTEYWMHYIYNESSGFTSENKGKGSDQMGSIVFDFFSKYVEEIEDNEGNR